MTQRALADTMRDRNNGDPVITAAAISQAERSTGHTTPRPEHLLAIADALGFAVQFFSVGAEDRANPAQVFFRHLRTTPADERRRCDSLVEIIEIVVGALEHRVILPPWDPPVSTFDLDPATPVTVAANDIERAATSLRQQLSLGLDPIDRPLTTVERAGVIVVRDQRLGDRLTPTASHTGQQVDAFCDIAGKRPIIVLTGAPGIPWDRDNYNVGHELGHVVLHTNTQRGPKSVEDHAHRFAGAFLAPADAIYDELPDSIDWRDYYELKLKWGISIAALIRRAYDLGKLRRDDYVAAMKYRAAQGWRTVEPGHELKPLTRPRMLALALAAADMTPRQLVDLTGVPIHHIETIIGPGPEPTVTL